MAARRGDALPGLPGSTSPARGPGRLEVPDALKAAGAGDRCPPEGERFEALNSRPVFLFVRFEHNYRQAGTAGRAADLRWHPFSRHSGARPWTSRHLEKHLGIRLRETSPQFCEKGQVPSEWIPDAETSGLSSGAIAGGPPRARQPQQARRDPRQPLRAAASPGKRRKAQLTGRSRLW